MTNRRRFDNFVSSPLRAALLGLALLLMVALTSISALAQSLHASLSVAAADVKAQNSPPRRAQPQPGPAQQEAPPTQDQAQPKQPGAEPETKITPQQAEELFRSVDEILRFASNDTHLPVLHPVKRELASRERVRSYITKHMTEDQDVQRLQRSSASLKKFGLVPRDFDLRSFLVNVLEEQVAGFYDAKTKTVYLLDWVIPEAQRPVLAHELTHALQDQSFDLDRWLKVNPRSDNKPNLSLDYTIYDPEEAQAAREAVSEGQAMAVLVDYTVAPSGQSIADSPLIAEVFKAGTIENTNSSPMLSSAPLYLKESLIFSYTYGLTFVQKLLTKGGRDLAFAGAMKNPPQDTREIMEPKTYLANQHVEPFYLPRLSPVLKGLYEKYDLGQVGQFDVYVLLKQYSGLDAAEALSPAWRGGTYMLLHRLHAAQPAKDDSAPPLHDLALVYVSRWATPGDAARFAVEYASWLPKKYKSVRPATSRGGNAILVDHDKFLTEDGSVFIEPSGDTVLVMEGFDDVTAVKLRDVVLARTRAGIEPGATTSLATRMQQALHAVMWWH